MDRRLAIAVAVEVLVLGFVVRWLTTTFEPLHGYGLALMVYWFAILAPLILLKLGVRGARDLLKPRWPGRSLFVMCILPAMVLGAAAILGGALASLPVVALIAVAFAALCNGTFEELFWRGALIDDPTNRPAMAGAVVLFTAWHLALLTAYGITTTGGAPVLLGGAFLLGVIWMLTRLRSGSVGTGVLSHIALNLFAFVDLVALNLPTA